MNSDWRDQAACGGYADVFFGPERESPQDKAAREQDAITICRPCPVRQPCLEDALSQPSQIGVAGGVGEDRRTALRNAALKREKRRAA